MSFKGLMVGVTGLKAQSKKMEVIGNNLANLNTAGFKKADVNFKEMFYDVVKNASGGDGANLGGSNPAQIGGGVSVASISSVFNQGERLSTGRTLDFMVEGNDFFVVKNGANDSIMLTRSGSFSLDANLNLVDTIGNKIQGFNVNKETGVVAAQAGNVVIDNASIQPNATSQLNLEDNIDSSVVERASTIDSSAWEVFSGGENFGKMDVSIPGGQGSRDAYGSGYYQDAVAYNDASATLDATKTIVTLNAVPASLVEGFVVGDTVTVQQGTNQVQRTISAVNVGTRQITMSSATPAGFAAATLTITNLSRGGATRGTSGAALAHNDVLQSQLSMVDENGKLLATFYRVSGAPKTYTRATANLIGGGTISVGTGEFNDIQELTQLFETALRDTQLTNYAATTDLSVGVNKFGKVSFGGTGLVEKFRLVINADNTEMLDRFTGIAMTDAAAVATTQARIDTSGEVLAAPALGLANRTINASKDWYTTSGLQNYGFSATSQATEYGEFAGLRFDGGATGSGYGQVQLSLINGLGNTVTKTFSMVPRDSNANDNEFSTMGELARLVQNTLRNSTYSSLGVDGTLQADQTATATFTNGRMSVATTSGVFRTLKLTAVNTTGDASGNITRTDSMNFDTVLGQLATGVNGKNGVSNLFIDADAKSQTMVFDSQGNEHTATTYFVRDRSSGLTNIEWKFKMGLNPNLNTFASDSAAQSVYSNTFNSIEDSTASRGVLAFDITSGDVLGAASGSDNRYIDTANITFLAKTNSQEANKSVISVDFTDLTSFNGKNTIIGKNVDGYAMGDLIRIATEENTGHINGVYSNGKIRTLAKVGLMSIINPEGLQKVGSSYFVQTPNSTAGGTAKGLDQVFAVTGGGSASTDSLSSKIHGGALEAANVDLTEELTDMIVTQRSFSASGKSITTNDEMLQEALNLKR